MADLYTALSQGGRELASVEALDFAEARARVEEALRDKPGALRQWVANGRLLQDEHKPKKEERPMANEKSKRRSPRAKGTNNKAERKTETAGKGAAKKSATGRSWRGRWGR